MAEIELGTADGSDEIKVYDEVFSQRKIPRNSDEGIIMTNAWPQP